MKRSLRIFMAVLALAGIFACIGLEPLHAACHASETSAGGEEEQACCFICHPAHHLWTPQEASGSVAAPASSGAHSAGPSFSRPEAPPASIFHPPSAL